MADFDVNLWLVRHAQTPLDVDESISGSSAGNDDPLTDLGTEQAVWLGHALKVQHIHPDRVFTSPADEALATASLVLDEMGVGIKPVTAYALQEPGQGSWTDPLEEEVYTEAGLIVSSWVADVLNEPLPEATLPEKVLFFTHEAAIKSLIGHIEGRDSQQAFDAEIPNASASLLLRRGGEWVVKYAGRTVGSVLNS